ncbi:hypothetical protein ACEYW6_21800 [Nostoc sp. UIC 10607]
MVQQRDEASHVLDTTFLRVSPWEKTRVVQVSVDNVIPWEIRAMIQF